MLIQIFLTLTLMLSYFLVFYKIGISFSKIIGRRVCVVCYSVSLTWLTLLLLKYLGILDVNKYLISVLIAQSAVGISNLSDEFAIINNIKVPQPILKFGTILYGTFAVLTYGFISEIFGLILVIPLMYLGILSMTPVNTGQSQVTPKSKELLEKLKKCCG
jgi:hypothetical protein